MVECAQHPDSVKLYITKIDFGPAGIKQVVTGLVPYLRVDQILNHLVVAIVNLKPAKLAKVESQVCALSVPCASLTVCLPAVVLWLLLFVVFVSLCEQAMILTSEVVDGESRTVQLLLPPADAQLGDRVVPSVRHVPPPSQSVFRSCLPPPPLRCVLGVCADATSRAAVQGCAVSAEPKIVSSTVWAAVVPELAIHGGNACFLRTPLVAPSGPVRAAEGTSDGAGIH